MTYTNADNLSGWLGGSTRTDEPPEDPWPERDPYDASPADEPPPDDLNDERLAFEVDRQLLQMRARKIARERFAVEEAGDQPPLDVGTLAQVLARPTEPRWRVEELQPDQGRLLLVAQRKTGKTVVALNYARWRPSVPVNGGGLLDHVGC